MSQSRGYPINHPQDISFRAGSVAVQLGHEPMNLANSFSGFLCFRDRYDVMSYSISTVRGKSLIVPDAIPEIALARAQALWVLSQFGFRTGGSHSTLLEYIKLLRRFGLPFSPDESTDGHRHIYRYEHLMELGVALSFRLHRILPWDVTKVLIEHRSHLRQIYRRAYLERKSGIGEPVQIKIGTHRKFSASGVYLDLNFSYIDDRLVSSGGPQTRSAAEAIEIYVQQDPGSQVRPPLPLSRLASEIVRLALNAPPTRKISKTFSGQS
jgi:hypothetical protein